MAEDYKSIHTGPDIDAAISRAKAGGEIDSLIQRKVNPNLLDNAYFGNPVDQRGGYVVPPNVETYTDSALTSQTSGPSGYRKVTAMTSTYCAWAGKSGTFYSPVSAAIRGYIGSGYTIDRWFVTSGSGLGVIVTEDGLTIDNKSGATVYMRQYLETPIPEGSFCFSAFAPFVSGAVSIYCAYTDGSFSNSINLADGLNSGYVVSTKRVNRIQLTIAAGAKIILKAVKLELGTEQTLAHQENGEWVLNEIPNYAEELAKCQRYFCPARYRGRAPIVTANGIQIDVPTPVTMRTTPTVVGSFGVMTTGGVDVDGFTISQRKALATGITLTLSKASHGLADASVWLGEDAYFDANL